MIGPDQIRELYLEACEEELQAFKPGNVSVYADGHDMTVEDFRISAEVSSWPICDSNYSVGEKIYYAVEATREAVGCNTNLGIILLCAPMIEAVSAMSRGASLRVELARVLKGLTIDDADWAFRAITMATPGGLGKSGSHDVAEKASVNLLDAMKLAARRDRIAFQYSTDFEDIFDFSTGLYYNAMCKRIGRKWAAVAVYAGLLSRIPDSHIERKFGDRYSGWVAAKMALLSEKLNQAVVPEQLLPLLYRMDREFKSKGLNPGTTADLTVATVFTVLLEHTLSGD